MRRKLGQHFLIDQEVIARILQCVDLHSDDRILEIGPGKGVLTSLLARQAKHVTAIEYDATLVNHLQAQFTGQAHVHLVEADARHLNYAKLFPELSGEHHQRIKVVANLPYYAAVPIMLSLFQYSPLFCHCTFMFQKEVAERITATPGNKSYGALSVIAQYYSQPEYCFSIPPEAFQPRPKVDSAVITLQFFAAPRIQLLDQKYFFQLVKYAFLTRRKTLKNSLTKHSSGVFPGALVQRAFQELGFHERIRGEELSVQDFATLSNVLQRQRSQQV